MLPGSWGLLSMSTLIASSPWGQSDSVSTTTDDLSLPDHPSKLSARPFSRKNGALLYTTKTTHYQRQQQEQQEKEDNSISSEWAEV